MEQNEIDELMKGAGAAKADDQDNISPWTEQNSRYSSRSSRRSRN